MLCDISSRKQTQSMQITNPHSANKPKIWLEVMTAQNSHMTSFWSEIPCPFFLLLSPFGLANTHCGEKAFGQLLFLMEISEQIFGWMKNDAIWDDFGHFRIMFLLWVTFFRMSTIDNDDILLILDRIILNSNKKSDKCIICKSRV